MTFKQHIVNLMMIRKRFEAINKEYQNKLTIFDQQDFDSIDAAIEALKTLDDMGNTMQKLLMERSKTYETIL